MKRKRLTTVAIWLCLTAGLAPADDAAYDARVMEVNVTHDTHLAAHTTIPLSGGCVVRLDPDPYGVLPSCGESAWLGLNCLRETTEEDAETRTFDITAEGRMMLDVALLALLADKPVRVKITDEVRTPSGRCTALRINVKADEDERPDGIQARGLDRF